MKILFRARTVLPVLKYGGTERMMVWLMKELVQRGHRVQLLGHPGSNVDRYGIELLPVSPELENWSHLIPKDTELVHVFEQPVFKLEIPYIVTIEGNGQPGEEFDQNTVFVSRKHASNHGSERFVHNGIDFDEYPFWQDRRPGWESFLFLAKAKWRVKNLTDCVSACRAAKKHLHVAGGRALALSRFIHSYGMVDQEKKRELFKKVNALLFPVRWEEPFGIAVIEAFAMGLPVIGSSYGSLPELITEDLGIVCTNYQDLHRAVQSDFSQRFDPVKIRGIAEKRFGISVIADQYLSLYKEAAKGDPLNSQRPRAQFHQRPELLLPF